MGGTSSFLKMGTRESTPSAWDRVLNEYLLSDYEKECIYTKILLLGTGNSGKSTILKQFQQLHQESFFCEETLLAKKEVVSNNVIEGVRYLVEYALSLQVENDLIQKLLSERARDLFFFLFGESRELSLWTEIIFEGKTVKCHSLIDTLWKDDAIQEVVEKRLHKLARIETSIEYFMSDTVFERICHPDYLPSPTDVLYCRQRTTSVTSIEFTLDGNLCKMFDVGGQRNERAKWISHFDDVDVIIFLVSMVDYCKSLYEDETENRLQEALSVFKEILNGPFFTDTDVVLFMNKKDLFEEIITVDPLRNYFPEYEGDDSVEEGAEFLCELFTTEFHLGRQHLAVKKSNIYVYQTIATNTRNMKVVLGLCQHVLLRKNLENVGIV